MRKTSQDGGDATSATSGVENEIKKPKAGLLLEFKSKKIGKRTAPNLSEESDDAVVEPLLQKTTDKTNQSAKYFAKAKADTVKEISKLFNDKKAQSESTSGFGTTESLLSEKDQVTTSKPSTSAPLHNYMNTNIFHSHNNSKANGTTKSQVLVEIDGSKQSGYNPSPLIFTTAKIHTDGKTKQMEPVQMTPAPISSTVEVSISKSGNIIMNEKKISNSTSVMNTVFAQPHVNKTAKENTVNVSSSNSQQNKDLMLTDKNSNPTTSLPAKVISPTQVLTHSNKNTEADSVNISKSNNITSAVFKVDISNTINTSKPITSPLNPIKISSPSETLKSTSIDTKNKPDTAKDGKGTKKLIDEPRILMSESKLKSTISENTKPIASVAATKPPSEPIKAAELLSKLPQTVQSNKNDSNKSEKSKASLDQDTKVKNTETISSQPIQNKNIKSPVSKDLAIKPNAITSKSLHQKNTSIESSTSKIPESMSDPSAKTSLSSSTKIPTQSKVIDSKLSKEIDKSPKPSANEIVKPTSKISLNNTATATTNKISSSTVKPVQSANPLNVSSGSSETSNKNINISSISNPNTVNNPAISTGASATILTNALKTQSPKTVTVTVNTKSTSVTSAKSSAKTSAASIKSPQISTPSSAMKQTNVTAKNASVKPPPLAFTKTPQVNTSSPGVSAPITKPAVSKVAQVSTSNTTGQKLNISSSVPPSSSTSSESSTKTKAPESNKKVESKPSDHTTDNKISKG